MRKIVLLYFLMSLLISCSDNSEELFMQPQKIDTRAVVSEVSPYFNWEDTTLISLWNINGPVVLPWYSSAAANIPSFILEDYKAADGWEMVYNTCSPSSVMQDDKYYLIFYNIFSGNLRGYVYNKNDVTSGDITFWQITLNEATTLLNDLGAFTLPRDQITDNREIVVSGLSNTPTKSLTRGWNVFEADFLMYDPDIINKNIAMSISPYDVDKANIELSGDVRLSSNGTMITVTNISSLQTPGFLNKGVSMLGDSAQVKVENFFRNSNLSGKLSSILSEGVGGIIKAGGSFLVKKFFGRSTTKSYVSRSDIKISTEGTIKVTGNATSQQQANVSPISRLMLPGSTPTIEDYFLPSYNKPLGVWSLSSAPVVKYSPYYWVYTILPQELVFDQGKNTLTCCMAERNVYELEFPKIMINPAILPFIEKYEVDARLFIERSGVFEIGKVTASCPLGRYEIVEGGTTPYYNNPKDSLYLLGGGRIMTIQKVEPKLTTFNREWTYPYQSYPGVPRYSSSVDNEMLSGGIVRISVTIYPKSPYNTEPIVTSRTFKPQFVLDSKYGK